MVNMDYFEDLGSLKKTIDTYLGLIFKIGLGVVIFATFFLFVSLTTEIYDTPKFLVLLIFTGVMLALLMLKFTIFNKVVLVRTPLDLPLVLLLAVGVASTFLSSSPYVSLLGNSLRIHSSLVGIIVYVLFYFVLVNSLKNARQLGWIFGLVIILAQGLSLVSLLSYAGIKLLPPPLIHGLNFTPTGSSFSTAAILAMLTPLVAIKTLHSPKIMMKLIYGLCLTLMGLTIALTGVWATWIAAGFGLGVVALSDLGNLKQPLRLISLAVPVVIVIFITILSVTPPIAGAENPLYSQAQSFPREVQLGFTASWKIAISAFRDVPFWGSGPGSFLFDFTLYKPIELNSTKLWTVRFDSAFNEYFQTLATLGGIGLLALLSLTALFISSAYKVLSTKSSELQTPLAIAGLVFFILLALHSSTLAVWVVGLLILAAFMVLNISETSARSWGGNPGDLKATVLRIAGNVTSHTSSEEIRVDALPGVLLIIALLLAIAGGYFGGKFVLADYHHKLAIDADSQGQPLIAYNELVAAEKLNPYSDLYRINLAKINFSLANAIAAAKGPTEASPSGSLTDQDKQNIQVLLSQSISEGRTATTLSPRSALNWEVLGLLYRQIAGVAQNALIFSLDSYGRAILQDPLNPQLRLNVGGVYYAVRNYDMAIRFFTDAVNLKPDFANGYYNLSVALKDKGDLVNAQAMAEKVLTLVDQSSQDYKIATDYLNELKSKNTSEIQPPASQTEGALQEENLPKVVDVGKAPEKIATPPAVKKPAATPSPTPAP